MNRKSISFPNYNVSFTERNLFLFQWVSLFEYALNKVSSNKDIILLSNERHTQHKNLIIFIMLTYDLICLHLYLLIVSANFASHFP